jgi:hypothetical protein
MGNTPGAIRHALKAGGTAMDQSVVTPINSSFTRVVAGAREIIWTDGNVVGGTCGEGAYVKRMVLGGSKATTQVLTMMEQGTCPALAQDAQAFYFTEGTKIMRVMKTP